MTLAGSILASAAYAYALYHSIRKAPNLIAKIPFPCIRHDWVTNTETATRVRDKGWVWRGVDANLESVLVAQICARCKKYRTLLIKEFHVS